MEKEFVPYEQALALKELGFDEPCLAFTIPNNENFIISQCQEYLGTEELMTQIPIYQQAFRWFREKYKLRGHVISDYDMFSYQIYGLIDNEFNLINGGSVNKEYEEAELECLKKLIEMVKEK